MQIKAIINLIKLNMKVKVTIKMIKINMILKMIRLNIIIKKII